MGKELQSNLGNLALRISFWPYFLQLYPSSNDPSSPLLEQIFTCSVHLGMVFLHSTNSKEPQIFEIRTQASTNDTQVTKKQDLGNL